DLSIVSVWAVTPVFLVVVQFETAPLPNHPLNKVYALSGDLSNIFRVKKGGYRICWIASSKLRRICILYIPSKVRKECNINDAYKIVGHGVMSGQFNDIFAKFGVRMRHLKGAATSIRINDFLLLLVQSSPLLD